MASIVNAWHAALPYSASPVPTATHARPASQATSSITLSATKPAPQTYPTPIQSTEPATYALPTVPIAKETVPSSPALSATLATSLIVGDATSIVSPLDL